MASILDHILAHGVEQRQDPFSDWRTRLREWIEAHRLKTILWEPTRACDLRCIHCGTPDDNTDRKVELTKGEVLDAFRQIKDDFDLSNLDSVSITGGEPTVRTDLPEMVSGIRSMGFDKIVMHTNGHKIAQRDAYLEKLVDSGFTGIGINIDGLEEAHNTLRNHPDSYNLSIEAYNRITRCPADLGTLVSTVITKLNLHQLDDLWDVVRDLERAPQHWRLIPLEPIGRGAELHNLDLAPEDVAHVVEFVLSHQPEILGEDHGIVVEVGCGGWYGRRLECVVRPYVWHCFAGIDTLGILHDGSIGGCNNIDPAYTEGNVRTDRIKDVWENRYERFRSFEWKRNGECAECPDWELCHGGDMHRRRADSTMIGKCFARWLDRQG